MSGWLRDPVTVPWSVDAMPVSARELLGDAIHGAVHPGHEWHQCAEPDRVYERWMPRFLERVMLSPNVTDLTGFLRSVRDEVQSRRSEPALESLATPVSDDTEGAADV